MKKFKELREHTLEEKLKASDPAGTYVHDFVHSDNPKFAGKSKAKRIQMALAASYAAKGKSRNEEVEQIDELSLDTLKSAERKNAQAARDYHMDDNKSWARRSAVRALNLQKRIKKKEKQTSNEEVEQIEELEERRNDTPTPYGSLLNRPSSPTVAQTGPRKGMITKKHATRLKDRIKANLNKEETESVEELEEDKYDRMLSNMLKKNPGVLKTHSKEVQKYNDTNSGKTLKQNIKKNPGVLKTHSNAVKRDKKIYGEEVEQIDELSKSTLGSYVKKATSDAVVSRKLGADFENRASRAKSPGMKGASTRLSDKFNNMSKKRQSGVGKAVERLTKEDFESVEEGVMNAVKNLAKKAGKALTGGSDEDQRKDLQRKMGVPQTGKKPTK